MDIISIKQMSTKKSKTPCDAANAPPQDEASEASWRPIEKEYSQGVDDMFRNDPRQDPMLQAGLECRSFPTAATKFHIEFWS